MSRARRSGLIIGLLCLVGCFGVRLLPAGPTHKTITVAYPKGQVFDAALLQAYAMNLDVKVIERDSGLMRFETALLSPASMEQYCVYPLQPVTCSAAPRSFTKAEQLGVGGSGTLSISILVSSVSDDSSAVDVRSNGTTTIVLPVYGEGRVARTIPVESNGKLEHDFLEGLGTRLQGQR